MLQFKLSMKWIDFFADDWIKYTLFWPIIDSQNIALLKLNIYFLQMLYLCHFFPSFAILLICSKIGCCLQI